MDAFYGEIRAFPFTFIPKNWLPCDGTIYNLSSNPELAILMSVISNLYGGDGRTSFGVPNLEGFVAIGAGTGPDGNLYSVGDSVGMDNVTLTTDQLPQHTHYIQSQVGTARADAPSNATLIASVYSPPYLYPSFASSGTQVNMDPTILGSAGGGAAHDNHQPYMLFRYCICALDAHYPIKP